MSTDVTRGPRVCPSCGRENAESASHCMACFTPLDGAVQATPPAPSDEYDPDLFRSRLPSSPHSGCSDAVVSVGVLLLTLFSAGLTFFVTCLGVGYVDQRATGFIDTTSVLVVSALASAAVGTLIIITFQRMRERRGRWR